MNAMVVMPLGEFGGGAERMLYNYLAHRRQDGSLRVFVVFLSPGKLADSVREMGYPTAIVSAGRVRELGRLLATQHSVGQLIDTWSIDRVLAWMPKACAYVALPARIRGVPLLIWRHDIPTSLDRLDKLVLRYGRPRSMACSSEAANRALQACGVSGVSTLAIHPGVAPVPFDTESVQVIRGTFLGNSRGPVVGTVTRLQPWKRVDLLLQSAALLKVRFPEVKVLVVGGESHGLSKGHAAQLQSLGRQLIGDDALFVGEQSNVGDWLQVMDVFVLPSNCEPFGIALVEALLAGKPVVACSGGGPDEIVGDEGIGVLLSTSPTPEDMAAAITRLLDPRARSRARTVNPKSAARFSPEQMAIRIDEWLTTADC